MKILPNGQFEIKMTKLQNKDKGKNKRIPDSSVGKNDNVWELRKQKSKETKKYKALWNDLTGNIMRKRKQLKVPENAEEKKAKNPRAWGHDL